MTKCISESLAKPGFLLLTFSVAISITACADKGTIRDEDRARYEALENELISAQQAEELKRRTEMRVAQKRQKLDSEPPVSAQGLLHNPSEQLIDPSADSNRSETASLNLFDSGPVITPIEIGQTSTGNIGVWALQNYPSPIDGSALCSVVSAPVIVINGTIETQVAVVISKSAVFLRTDSSFDTTASETGYRIDAGIPIGFDHYLNELTAVVDDSYSRLISALRQGATLRISFAYTPQLSTAETHVVELSLETLAQPLTVLDSCDGQGDGKYYRGAAD